MSMMEHYGHRFSFFPNFERFQLPPSMRSSKHIPIILFQQDVFLSRQLSKAVQTWQIGLFRRAQGAKGF